MIICTICARGGSQGVKGKNIRQIAGKPLLEWTVKIARESNLFDYIAFSSDSPEILSVAAQAGVDLCVDRPSTLATNSCGKVPAIFHCLQQAELKLGGSAEYFFDLDVTSPLRIVDDIKGAYILLRSSGVSSIITGSVARRSPYFNMVEEKPDGSVGLVIDGGNILRRQDSPKCFDMNASIYAWKRDIFIEDPKVFYSDTLLYEMPEERSFDIDTPLDFKIVEMLLNDRS